LAGRGVPPTAKARDPKGTREQTEAKVWVRPTVNVAVNEGFAQHELRKIVRLVEANRELIEHEWNSRKKTS
jgi:hypothetical protein